MTVLYRTERHKTSKLADVAGSFDNLYESEDLVNNAVSSNAMPVTQGEQAPVSPLFSDIGYVVGPSALGDSPVVQELPLPGHSPAKVPVLEFSSTMDQPSFTTLSAVGESPAGPSSTPLSASISTCPLIENNFMDGTDFQFFDPPAFNHLDLLSTTSSTLPEVSWSDFFSGELSATAPTEIGSGLHTPVPTTPSTGYPAPALATPGYTPGLLARELPVELGDNQFVFNSTETVAPEQPMWSACRCLECAGQQALVPSTPVIPTTAPAPAPAIAPVPSPVPAVPEQFVQSVGFPNDPHSWNETPQAFESDQPQAAGPLDPLVPGQIIQNDRLTAIQQVLNAVNMNNIGRDGKPGQVGLAGAQILWLSL